MFNGYIFIQSRFVIFAVIIKFSNETYKTRTIVNHTSHSQYFLLNILIVMKCCLFLFLPFFYHNIYMYQIQKIHANIEMVGMICYLVLPDPERIKNWLGMKESYLPFHSITTLNIICESSRKIDNFRSDNLFTQCPGFVMYDSRFTTYKFFWNFFSFEPILYRSQVWLSF